MKIGCNNFHSISFINNKSKKILMKTTTFLIMLYLSISNIILQKPQTVYIEYEQRNFYSDKFLNSLSTKIKKRMLNKMKWQKAVLIQSGNKSFYTKVGEAEVETEGGVTKQTVSISPKYIYFKDFKKKKLYIQKEESCSQCMTPINENLLIEKDLFYDKWKLLPETKIIDGIRCHKATTEAVIGGGTIVAWYTDKYGIQNGPAGYHGVPGLIVYLYSTGSDLGFEFKMKRIEFQKEKVQIPPFNPKAKRITFDEYLKKYVGRKALKTSYKKTETIYNK